jgi:hypothetical protein
MRILHNVDNKWITDGQRKWRDVVHVESQRARHVGESVDNVDNHFLATKIKDFDIRVNT